MARSGQPKGSGLGGPLTAIAVLFAVIGIIVVAGRAFEEPEEPLPDTSSGEEEVDPFATWPGDEVAEEVAAPARRAALDAGEEKALAEALELAQEAAALAEESAESLAAEAHGDAWSEASEAIELYERALEATEPIYKKLRRLRGSEDFEVAELARSREEWTRAVERLSKL